MSDLSQSLGKYISHLVEKDGVYIHSENADVRIRVWSDNIIQIHISTKQLADSFSFAVSGSPEKTVFSVKNLARSLEVSTKSVKLKIKKPSLRFTFLTNNGKVLNEDDPAFGTSWINDEMSTYKKLQHDERFVGLGEKTKNLNRRGEAFVNWNTDAFAYSGGTDPLYVSTPFYIGLHNDLAYGIFLDNSYRSKFNFGASNNRFASFSVEGGDMSYFFIHHKNVADIVRSYAKLTGTMPMPPKWSLGYQQCRFSYYPEAEIHEIASTFRDKKIPCDVIYFDIHYMDKYKLFTWNKDRFPEPKKLIKELDRKGFKTVVIVDPGIKMEDGYEAYEDGLKNDVFIKYPDRSNYSANVWPGECCFPDFTKEPVRQWWGEWMKFFTDDGIEGVWNDMNEPASWGQDTPDLIQFDYEGNPATHKRGRNVYGMQMARSTYEGLRRNLKNKRPFVLSRSGFSGVQRFAAIWTGDNTANDESMFVGARMISNLGLAGIPYAGFDVGGFVGDTSSQLYQRWIALGAFTPFFRGHTMVNSKRSEPWSYGEETEEIARNYISLRYRLMPYLYSIFKQASLDGTPVCRSLVIDYPFDSKIYDHRFQNQYLFGPSFLVCPVASGKEFEKIYLPKGEWYDLYNDTKLRGSKEYVVETPHHRLPVYMRSSSIVPMQGVSQFSGDDPGDTLYLHVYNGRSSKSFEYYEDDGISYDFEKGMYFKREIKFDPARKLVTLGKSMGKYKSQFSKAKIYFHGFFKLKDVKVNRKKLKIRYENFRFIEPISNFDPFFNNSDPSIEIRDLPYVEIRNQKSPVTVSY